MSTFHKIHIHIVFATRKRQPLIDHAWKNRLYDYVSAVVQNQGQKMLAINGMPDHIHLLIGHRPTSSLSSLVKDIKLASAAFIRREGFFGKTILVAGWLWCILIFTITY